MEKTKENSPIFQVKGLKKYYTLGKHTITKAVDDVSFEIYKGETLGLVGESGCGKTTCGRCMAGLLEKTEGDILFQGKQVLPYEKNRNRKAFAKNVQTIFQDPFASLDSRMKTGDIIAEGARIQHLISKKDEQDYVMELLDKVGLRREYIDRYVHEFSGGQRQRIGIARALAVEPEFIICDEPVSALDVSVQAQIINLLKCMQEEKGLTYLFIAHDLSMVQYISDRVAVMYRGSIVELATSDELYSHPLHPYTKALFSAIPIPDPDIELQRKRIILHGEIGNKTGEERGCKFCDRCYMADERCATETPKMQEIDKGHFVCCHKCSQM